jgi:hypothetical protein
MMADDAIAQLQGAVPPRRNLPGGSGLPIVASAAGLTKEPWLLRCFPSRASAQRTATLTRAVLSRSQHRLSGQSCSTPDRAAAQYEYAQGMEPTKLLSPLPPAVMQTRPSSSRVHQPWLLTASGINERNLSPRGRLDA